MALTARTCVYREVGEPNAYAVIESIELSSILSQGVKGSPKAFS